MSLPDDSGPIVEPSPSPAELEAYEGNGHAPQGASAGLLTYLHGLRRWWWLAGGLGILCGTLAAITVWRLQSDYFTSVAVLRVAAKEEQLVFETVDKATQSAIDLYKNTQEQLIKGDFVLIAALRDPEVTKIPVIREAPDPVRWLREELKVEFPGGGEIMRVSLTCDNPKHATALVDAVVEAYLSETVDKERERRQKRRDELDRVFTEKEAEVRRKRSDLKQLAEQLGTGDQGALALKQQMALQQFVEVRREAVRAQSEMRRIHGEIESARTALRQVDETPISDAEVRSLLRADPVGGELLAQIAGIEDRIEAVRSKAQDRAVSHFTKPLVAEREDLKERLEARRAQIRAELPARRKANIQDRMAELGRELAAYEEQEKRLKADLEKYRKDVESIGGSSIDVEMMRAEIERLEEILEPVADERERLQVELGTAPRITLLQKASAPRSPDNNSALSRTGMAAFAGMLLPAVIIVLWDSRYRRINGCNDVSGGLGLEVIGSVPRIPSWRLIPSKASARWQNRWQSLFDESVRGLSARLLHEANQGRSRILLVTSAGRREGKTTLATHLAVNLAEMGFRTLLVDFDLRSPELAEFFEVPSSPGLGELMRQETTLEEALKPTSTKNLFLLTAGGWTSRYLGALSNGVSHALFDQLREKHDFVVIDGSPILSMAEARLVSQLADGVILSVLRDVSRAPKIAAAGELLAAFGVRSLGAVVTGSANEVHCESPAEETEVAA